MGRLAPPPSTHPPRAQKPPMPGGRAGERASERAERPTSACLDPRFSPAAAWQIRRGRNWRSSPLLQAAAASRMRQLFGGSSRTLPAFPSGEPFLGGCLERRGSGLGQGAPRSAERRCNASISRHSCSFSLNRSGAVDSRGHEGCRVTGVFIRSLWLVYLFVSLLALFICLLVSGRKGNADLMKVACVDV